MEGKSELRKASSSLSPQKLREDSFAARSRVDLATVPNGETITALYDQLNSCITVTTIKDLDQKVGTVLKQHEVDFLSVYRGHMFNIQREMRVLKEKASEEENKRRRDTEILKLQQERDWFRNEAVRLDKLCKGAVHTDYKQSVDNWKAKVTALEEDKLFLQSQVLTAQKNHTRSQEELESLRQSALQEDQSREESKDMIKEVTSSVRKPAFVTNSGSPESLRDSDGLEQRYKGTIHHLKQQIKVQNTSLRRLKSVKADYFLERGELEDFFLECIDEVRKSILARRLRGAQLLSRSSSKVLDSALKQSKSCPESAEEVTLEMFTDSDKRKVIELLLSQEAVLLMLHRSLFPEKRSQSVTRIQDPSTTRTSVPNGSTRRGTPGQFRMRITPGRPTHPRHSLFR